MAFKGKSTIELRNAETGELEQRVEDENMVTNACYNLVNGSAGKNTLNTLLDNCFSGLLLFEKNITEDSNIMIMPAGNRMVGKAAGVYSKSIEPLIGNLNEAETKVLENGKRYVWDFSTDRGNGTIRCAALTSYGGGRCGYRVTPTPGSGSVDYSTMFQSRDYPLVYSDGSANSGISCRNSILTSLDAPYTDCDIIGCKNEKLIFAKAKAGESSIIFRVRTTLNQVGLREWTPYAYSEKTVTSSKKLCFSCNLFYLDGKYISIYVTSATTFDVVTFDAETFEIISEETVACQDTNFLVNSSFEYHNPILYKGYYYIAETGGKQQVYYYKINVNDVTDYTARALDITIPNQGLSSPTIFGCPRVSRYGEVLIFTPASILTSSSYTFTYAGIKVYDGENLFRTQIMMYDQNSGMGVRNFTFLTNTDIPIPYAVVYGVYSVPRLYDFIFTPFLSTINNLSTPVVKNETQTMKVTYEITEI